MVKLFISTSFNDIVNMVLLLLATLIMSYQAKHFLVRLSPRFRLNMTTIPFCLAQTSSGEGTGTGNLEPGTLKVLSDSFLKELGQEKKGVMRKKTSWKKNHTMTPSTTYQTTMNRASNLYQFLLRHKCAYIKFILHYDECKRSEKNCEWNVISNIEITFCLIVRLLYLNLFDLQIR